MSPAWVYLSFFFLKGPNFPSLSVVSLSVSEKARYKKITTFGLSFASGFCSPSFFPSPRSNQRNPFVTKTTKPSSCVHKSPCSSNTDLFSPPSCSSFDFQSHALIGPTRKRAERRGSRRRASQVINYIAELARSLQPRFKT